MKPRASRLIITVVTFLALSAVLLLLLKPAGKTDIVASASSSTTTLKVAYTVKDYGNEIKQANSIIDSQKPEDCENITEPELSRFREMCFYVNAVTSGNESVCAGIREGGLRATCEKRILDRKSGKTRGAVVEEGK
jgi:hypothetical protein